MSDLEQMQIRLQRERAARKHAEAIVEQKTRELHEASLLLEQRVRERTLELQVALDQALEASRARSQLLANMSLEIRTSMDGIIGMNRLALDTNLTAVQREYLTSVASSAEILRNVLNDFLDLPKIELGALDFDPADGAGESLGEVAEPAPEKRLDGPSRSLRVLLAEDNEVNQRLALILLQRMGHQVTLAANGVEAVERFAAARFDLVLMDVQMPQLDGLEATLAMRDMERDGRLRTPIVALTANALKGDRERCLEAGMDSYLSKPLDESALLHVLQGVEGKSVSMAPARPALEAVLDEHELMARVGNRVDLDELSRLFVARYPGQLERLDKACARGDVNALTLEAHGLKGSLLVLAAKPAAELARRLEHSSNEGSWARVQGVLDDLRRACAEVHGTLDRLGSGSGEHVVGRVLIVDDDPTARLLARKALAPDGHEVLEAESGEEALEVAAREGLDAVLLDVVMPGMNGLEVCRALKAGARTSRIPILLLTALEARNDRLVGIEAGASDFIHKPFDPREIALRVRNAVRGKQLFDKLQHSYEELRRMEELRDSLTHMLVHDLRNPLTAIQGFVSVLAHTIEQPSDRQRTSLTHLAACTSSMIEMVSAILDVNRLEADELPLELGEHEVEALLGSGLAMARPEKEIGVEIVGDVDLRVRCDEGLVRRVIINLVSNAVKYTPRGTAVELSCEVKGRQVVVRVRDKGPGIAKDHQQRIFDKFAQIPEEGAGRSPYSSGLGLTFCRLVVEKHGGVIGVDSEAGQGSTFWFTLPLVSSVLDRSALLARLGGSMDSIRMLVQVVRSGRSGQMLALEQALQGGQPEAIESARANLQALLALFPAANVEEALQQVDSHPEGFSHLQHELERLDSALEGWLSAT